MSEFRQFCFVAPLAWVFGAMMEHVGFVRATVPGPISAALFGIFCGFAWVAFKGKSNAQ